MTKGRSPGDEQSERVRRLVRKVRDEQFKGSATETAKALGVTPTTVSTLLSGKTGPGMQVLEGLRDLTGLSLDEIVYGSNRPALPTEGIGMRHLVGVEVAGALPGWDDVEARAKARFREVPEWAWEAARASPAPAGAAATVDLAVDLAYVAWRHMGAAERARYEAAALARASERLRSAPKPKD